MSAKLQLINIAFKYKGIGASENYVLHDINLEFNKNECTAVVGPSGSGKTTLIQHFTGLLKPDVGKVLFNDVDIWSKKYSFQELRRKIGIVFQFPESQLFEETVYKDVAFGPTNLGVNASEIPDRVYAALEAVEIKPDKFKDRSPFKLSEGEKRRVAIAGILAMDPEMIVFDEPTAGLDPRGVRRMENLVERLIGAGKSVVLITHNMDFVAQVASRVIVMSNGTVLSDTSPERLFSDPELLKKADLEISDFLLALENFKNKIPSKFTNVLKLSDLLSQLESD